jgi:hypothetical protein
MSEHTLGRLEVAVEVFDNDGCPETVIQGMGGAASVAVALDFGPNNPNMRYANARRLVACWNACENVSLEVLEAINRPADVSFAMAVDRLVRDRDDLLAALKGMLAIVSDSRGVTGYHLNGDEALWAEFPEVDAARAAIAKAEAGRGEG